MQTSLFRELPTQLNLFGEVPLRFHYHSERHLDMPYKDPAKKKARHREYMREYQRSRRQSAKTYKVPRTLEPLNVETRENVETLRPNVETRNVETRADVRPDPGNVETRKKLEPVAKARVKKLLKALTRPEESEVCKAGFRNVINEIAGKHGMSYEELVKLCS